VAHHLLNNGIEVVLTGGACVSIYSHNRYASLDLDFVTMTTVHPRLMVAVLARGGFRKEGRVFVHPECPFAVDILAPPLSIGAEPVRKTATLTVRRMKMKLLTPTDSVKDRLAAYYYWNDLQALEQALLICRHQLVHLASVRRWSDAEGHLDKFREFRKTFMSDPKTRKR